jgi:predicted Zn-dependent peptidase
MDKNPIKKIKINDIFTVLLNYDGNAQSSTCGFWCDGGANKEHDGNNGIAHVLEHMMFKGTTKRNGEELSSKVEQLGAYSNAYTSLESVAYYFSVAPTNLMVEGKNNLMTVIELLFEMLLESSFPEEELTKEKDVIIQELKMYEDDLEERCSAALHEIAYKTSTYLHREIIGTEPIIRSFTSQDLKKFMKEHYNNIYFVITGNFDEQLVVDYCKSMGPAMANFFEGQEKKTEECLYVDGYKEVTQIKNWANQAQAIMSWKTVDNKDKKRPVFDLISCILGKGMSSILFQRVRNQLGLVYSIYAETSYFNGSGALSVRFKTFNDKVQQVIDIVNKSVKELMADINEENIQKAKNITISSRIKRYEGVQSKAFFLGESALMDDNDLSIDEYIAECNKVTKADIIACCQEFFTGDADKVSKLLTE